MSEVLRLSALALFAVGPVVAVMAMLGRRASPAPTRTRITGWRGCVPAVLLPVEWGLPPILIAFRVGEVGEVDELGTGWLPVRAIGLAVGVAGAVLLAWGAARLGRLMVHAAAVRAYHVLIQDGPYRFVRHPVYAGYLALLLGAGVATPNMILLALWPVSFLGILIQATSEDRVLRDAFGPDHEHYTRRTGRLCPRLRGRPAGES